MATITRPLISLLSRSMAVSKNISTTGALLKSIEDLEKAKEKVMQLKEDPGNVKKLELYSLFKQVREWERARGRVLKCMCSCVP